MIKIYPYKQGSRSARALADVLGGRVLLLEGSRYRYRERDLIVNWGNSRPPPFPSLNGNAEELSTATNKLKFFRRMGDTDVIPRFWEDRRGIPDDAFPIVCRTVLKGHSGRGIVIAENRQELVDASLYVEYLKKKEEFRIHLGKKRVFRRVSAEGDRRSAQFDNTLETIAIQKKATRHGEEPTDWRVRNHHNGFIFIRGGFTMPDQCLDAARVVFDRIDLDFGAVDVIWNETKGRATVLEVNTAPGLEGQTIIDYKNYFNSLEN